VVKLKEIREKIEQRIIIWLAGRLPDCKPMTAMFSQSLDRKMSWRERITMRLHLYTCQACRRYVEQIEFMHENFRNLENENTRSSQQSSLSEEAKERIKTVLKTVSRKN
jgi:predicted anti-sigma-YlaC factor YlaD